MVKSTAAAEKRSMALARECATILWQNRGDDILLLDVRKLCGYTDFILVATATSRPQMRGLAKQVEKGMRQHRLRQLGRSGVGDDTWVLLDYGDIVIHVFNPETREYYQLENLWGDAPEIKVEFKGKRVAVQEEPDFLDL